MEHRSVRRFSHIGDESAEAARRGAFGDGKKRVAGRRVAGSVSFAGSVPEAVVSAVGCASHFPRHAPTSSIGAGVFG
ncbi:MAG: hypothetical protein M3494_13940 [Actinomycetota bacterium]|nr:hypothetical protein [Rubrobacter sp.]MDQ3509091.1 hypothetical protein [Actinomycetota bacterium]